MNQKLFQTQVNQASSKSKLPHQQQPNYYKTRLWKQLQSTNLACKYSLKETSKILQYTQQDQKTKPPIKKKPKCPTISNFLKNTQVHADNDNDLNLNLSGLNNYDCSNKLDTQSQILSILDIRYSDIGASHIRDMGRSLLADRKFQVFLLISSFKQLHFEFKEQIKKLTSLLKTQLQDVSIMVMKLTKKYENEMQKKEKQNINLQGKVYQLLKINSEEKSKFEKTVRQKDGRQKELQRAIASINQKLKNQKEQKVKEIKKNKQLTSTVKKNEANIQELQKIVQNLQLRNQKQKMESEKKISEKYQTLIKQLIDTYEVRIQNCKNKSLSLLNLAVNSNKVNPEVRMKKLIQPKSKEEKRQQSAIKYSKDKIIQVPNLKSYLGQKLKNQDTLGQNNKFFLQIDRKKQQQQISGKQDSNYKITLNLNTSNSNIDSASSGRRFARTSKQPSHPKSHIEISSSQQQALKPHAGVKISHIHSIGSSCPNLNQLLNINVNNYIPNRYYLAGDKDELSDKMKTRVFTNRSSAHNENQNQGQIVDSITLNNKINSPRSENQKKKQKQFQNGVSPSQYLSLRKTVEGQGLQLINIKAEDSKISLNKKLSGNSTLKNYNCIGIKNNFLNCKNSCKQEYDNQHWSKDKSTINSNNMKI